jgi:hypothetical protein
VCHETIYQAVYHGREGRPEQAIDQRLRTGRPLRKRRRRADERNTRFVAPAVLIDRRPRVVETSGRLGDRESAIRATWPQAEIQLCVVHLVRSSLRYSSKKHWSRICAELREIYTAPSVDAARARFDEFTEAWRDRYPAMISTWEQAWSDFVPFLDFPIELRTLVYTTNAIESLNARFRRAVRTRGHFPSEQAALKVLYLVATERRKNRSNPTGRVHGWKHILNALTIHHGDRIQAANQPPPSRPVAQKVGQSPNASSTDSKASQEAIGDASQQRGRAEAACAMRGGGPPDWDGCA